MFGAFRTAPVRAVFEHSALSLPNAVMHQAATSVYLALQEDPIWHNLLKNRPAPRLSAVRFNIFSIYIEKYIRNLRVRDSSLQTLECEPLPPVFCRYEKPAPESMPDPATKPQSST